ncbi:MAG: hypothetical protein ACI9F9_002467 [Candidatus Paceibacteria bacterium]|jgi:hypothetical protein
MSQDPSGHGSPLGDNVEFPESPQGEDFLGLNAPPAELPLESGEPDEGPGLTSPDPEEFQVLESQAPPMDAVGEESLNLDALERFVEDGDFSGLEALADNDAFDGSLELDENESFDGMEEEGEDEESASWLMEFDHAEDPDEEEDSFAEASREQVLEGATQSSSSWIGRAILVMVSVAAGTVGAKFFADKGGSSQDPVRPMVARLDPETTNHAGTPSNNGSTENTTSTKGALEAGALTVEEVASAMPEELAGSENNPGEMLSQPPTAGPETVVNPNKASKAVGIATTTGGRLQGVTKNGPASKTNTRPETRVAGGAASPVPVLNTQGASTGQATSIGSPGPQVVSPSSPAIAVDWKAPDPANAVPTGPGSVDTTSAVNAQPETGLRTASVAELASIWPSKDIPMAEISGAKRWLTPGVGRVRVLLAAGEVFEGKLYAVGERKLWIDTKLGKMALLAYQIDRVEHIVDAEGDSLLGGDSSNDLNGLRGVRVRTAGGVFYGKLLSQEGATVTIVTDTGARITLTDAHVESAGRMSTHLLNPSGALAKAEPEEATPKR